MDYSCVLLPVSNLDEADLFYSNVIGLEIKEDYYVFDEQQYAYVGQVTKNVLQLGDEVYVKHEWFRDDILIPDSDVSEIQAILPGVYKVIAYNSKNIAVNGKGIIDGQGRELALAIDSLHHTGVRIDPKYNYRRMRPEDGRGKLISFVKCDSITMTQITLKNSPGWTQCFRECKNIVIDFMKVESRAYWNNDGVGYYRDASFIKVKNISLGYTFSQNILDKLKLKGLRVYGNVLNPFVLTKYDGYDPEWAGAGLGIGRVASITYQLGLSVKL